MRRWHGLVDNDADDDGVCDDDEVTGCTEPTACNYDATSTTDTDNRCALSQVCDTCSGETDGTGTSWTTTPTTMGSAMTMRSQVAPTPRPATTTPLPPPTPTTRSALHRWRLRHLLGETDGTVVDNDADDDGVCDDDEVTGCTDSTACNYDSDPTTDTDNCALPQVATPAPETRRNWHCRGQRRDDDGVCDADEITGCTDPTACNYDATPPPTPTTPSALHRWRLRHLS